LYKLSHKGGEVLSNHAVTLWSNIRIRLLEREGETPLGELYAKVVHRLPEEQPGFAVHFTSLSPEAESFIQRLLAVH
jgi:hypothetical protein